MQRTQTYARPTGRTSIDMATWIGNGMATLLAGLAIASGAIGMLVAFGEIGSSAEPFRDGLIWLFGGVILSLAANIFRREHHVVSASSMAATTGSAVSSDRRRDDDRRESARTGAVRDAHDLNGMTVVATEEAREVGTVKDVLYDPADRAVMALVVAPLGTRDARMFVVREYVRGIGKDAVTIQSEENLQGFATKDREREFSKAGVRLNGMQVMTDQGNDVGKVGRVTLTDDCRIAGLEAGGGVFRGRRKIRMDDVVSIGVDRVIVSRVSGK